MFTLNYIVHVETTQIIKILFPFHIDPRFAFVLSNLLCTRIYITKALR